MTDIEVHIDYAQGHHLVGLMRLNEGRKGQSVSFEYDRGWVEADHGFSLEPALLKSTGVFPPGTDREIFGSLGDSAPDTWGRQLMRKQERRCAQTERRVPRTLLETDYLLGVADVSRLGALRFRRVGEEEFQAPSARGVPGLVSLGNLLAATERTLRDEETDEDLQMIFAPGSSLGGARPKASVLNQHGRLSIAKFPKETDGYGQELWEVVALDLAGKAGIQTAETQLIEVAGKLVVLSRRFDRTDEHRIPFLSAMSMMQLRDGERASYPELVDVLGRYGARAKQDAHELFRRMVFNILISNVDDHLRNHGFLWNGKGGWVLSPAYDVNPVPTDVKPRILTTTIDLEDGTCDIELARSVAGYFNLQQKAADGIIADVAEATRQWREAAGNRGAKVSQIERMASAFEHDDLRIALSLR